MSRYLYRCSAFLGNVLEHYDSALYGFLAPFLAPLFFPGTDPVQALVFAYAIIPIGMTARPLGSMFFGYLGDKYGRKQALIYSLLGMAVVTVCMAGLPVYSQVGYYAPVLLALGRIIQNFFSAGESVTGVVYLLETVDEDTQDMVSSSFGASTIGGILLAALGISVLTYFDIVDNYWRVLYLLGGSTALCAWLLRLYSPVETIPAVAHIYTWTSLLQVVRKHRNSVAKIAVAAGFSYATYSIAFILFNGFVPLIAQVTKEQVIHLNTAMLMVDFLAFPLFGWLASRFSREKILLASTLATLLSGMPLFMLLEGAALYMVIFVRVIIILLGVAFASVYYSWAKSLVVKEHRCFLIALSNALGSQIFGGPTSTISLWLFHYTGNPLAAAAYWVLLSCVTLLLLRQTNSVPNPLLSLPKDVILLERD